MPRIHRSFGNPLRTRKRSKGDSSSICSARKTPQILVAEESGQIVGFIIGQIRNPPPVYDPGGKACVIDDFAVASDERWSDVGENLKSNLEKMCQSLGVKLTVTVCGEKDISKRGFIRSRGEEIASEWYIKVVD